MTYRVIKNLVGAGPNPDVRFCAIESEHEDEAVAHAESDALRLANYLEEEADPRKRNPGYRYSWSVEQH